MVKSVKINATGGSALKNEILLQEKECVISKPKVHPPRVHPTNILIHLYRPKKKYFYRLEDIDLNGGDSLMHNPSRQSQKILRNKTERSL